MTRFRRIAIGAEGRRGCGRARERWYAAHSVGSAGGETVEVVLVEDPASVQGAYEKIKDAFAEVGTAEGPTRSGARGLNAKF